MKIFRKSSSAPAAVDGTQQPALTAPPSVSPQVAGATSADCLLRAAEGGWGVTTRFALLRLVDRWPAAFLGATGVGLADAVRLLLQSHHG